VKAVTGCASRRPDACFHRPEAWTAKKKSPPHGREAGKFQSALLLKRAAAAYSGVLNGETVVGTIRRAAVCVGPRPPLLRAGLVSGCLARIFASPRRGGRRGGCPQASRVRARRSACSWSGDRGAIDRYGRWRRRWRRRWARACRRRPEALPRLILATRGQAWRGFRASLLAPDRLGAFLAIGLTMMVAAQALINISVVLSLVPTKGIPLPFVSNGGSSLLVNLMAMGILLNITQHASPTAATAAEGRG